MIQKGREKLLLAPATRGNFRWNNMRRLCAHDNQPSLALVGIFVMKYKEKISEKFKTFAQGRKRTEKERANTFGEGIYLFCRGEEER